MKEYISKGSLSNRPHKKSAENDDDWMITYADMITLLFAFFVLLVAISNVDEYKYERVAQSIESSVGKKKQIEKRLTLEQVFTNVEKIIEEEDIADQAEVNYSPVGVTIRFKGNTLFPTASAKLSDRAKPIINKLATEIKSGPYRIDVEGHTDDRPVSTSQFPSNWELSGSRASSVVRYLLENQVQSEKLRAVGYADTQPLLPNRNDFGENIPENQAYNRRVEIIFRAK